MGCYYPKSGKKGSRPKAGPRVTEREERVGDPYRYNAKVGRSDDVAYRNMQNDYGKTAQKQDRVTDGLPRGYHRTTIIVR